MFELKEKENTAQQPIAKRASEYKASIVQSEKQLRLIVLRHVNFCQILNWRIPTQHFLTQIEQVDNPFSLLVTLMDISDDPQWRNSLPHLCVIVRQLHNLCIDFKGLYLEEMKCINHYQ